MKEALQNIILTALGTVQDPDLKKDLVSLGMIQSLQTSPEAIKFDLVLTTPACPLQELLKKACVMAIEQALGKKIAIHITIKAIVTSANTNQQGNLKEIKNIIAICAGKGGVGKSTIAANLAVSLAKTGAAVGLLDADIFGPSLPALLGCEHKKPQIIEKNGKKYIEPLIQHTIKFVSMGSLVPAEDAIVWRGPMASTALKQLLYDTNWTALDYLLIDLPPGTSDIHLTLVQQVLLAGIIIVTTPQKIALLDVIKNIAFFQKVASNVPLLGIIENMSHYEPEALQGNKLYHPFGEGGGTKLANQYQIPLLGKIPLLTAINEGSEQGIPAALNSCHELFTKIAGAMAQQLTIHHLGKKHSVSS